MKNGWKNFKRLFNCKSKRTEAMCIEAIVYTQVNQPMENMKTQIVKVASNATSAPLVFLDEEALENAVTLTIKELQLKEMQNVPLLSTAMVAQSRCLLNAKIQLQFKQIQDINA